MSTISKMGEKAASDRLFSKVEAQQIVDKAKSNGVVSKQEKKDINAMLTKYKDLFEPGAAEILQACVGSVPPPPSDVVTTVPLSETGAARPVFVSSNGDFVTTPNTGAPANAVDLGDGMFRAAELVDDARQNPLAKLDGALRGKVLDKINAAVLKAADPRSGLDEMQAKQLRSSCATSLLALAEASPEADLRKKAVDAYVALVKAEKFTPLRESMIFNLHGSEISRSGETKVVSDELMRELAPLHPPYEKWFQNGNKTVNMEWTVGQGEFWKGFTNKLKANGFKPVGAESQYGASTYEKTVNKPGVGDTVFRITVREGGTNMMSPAGKAGVQVFGYDGHSDWGRNISRSVRNAPTVPDGGEGQLFFYNMCVGKSGLDKVKDKFPNMQVVTTYAASNYYTDGNGQMTTGEGVQALLAMVDDIAARAPWTKLHKDLNAAANIGWGRTWDNYITPVSTMTREKVLDRDNDGQSDYLDKVYNFNTFRVSEDTRRELTPVRQDRPASVLDGTKVLMSGNMINTISEFSSILDRVNRDSKVVPDGWFEPKDTEKEIVKFEKVNGRDGKPEYRMKINARYAHASEDMLKALAIYEFNRYLNNTGQLRMDPVDAKINGLILACHSLDIDEGYRDQEQWKAFLTKYNLPDVSWQTLYDIKEAEHHHYSGSDEMVAKVRAALPRETIERLKQASVGEPQ